MFLKHAGLQLKKGEYRPLTEEEVQKLKNTGGSSAEKQKKC